MTAPSTRLLAIAAAVLVLTNAEVLGGVAWNRSAPPDSELELGARELKLPWQGPWTREDSGLSLQLQWRAPAAARGQGAHPGWVPGSGPPLWLDAAKMRALGFPDAALLNKAAEPGWPQPQREARDVLLVLELAGPAWQAAQQQAREQAEAAIAAGTDGKTREQAERFLQDEAGASRLFAVDAGLDRDALRARWPERSRHAIVHARVRPLGYLDTHGVAGMIESVLAGEIAVPHRLRGELSALLAQDGKAAGEAVHTAAPGTHWDKPFTARIAFGRRLEPWLVSLQPAPRE